jgi:hypothetical protein
MVASFTKQCKIMAPAGQMMTRVGMAGHKKTECGCVYVVNPGFASLTSGTSTCMIRSKQPVLPGFSPAMGGVSHRLQAVVAEAVPFSHDLASARLLDQRIHPHASSPQPHPPAPFG